MKLKSIRFGKNSLPKTVLVEMSLLEAAGIARWTGEMTNTMSVSHGVETVYDCLVDGVFNPYFEDGYTEVAAMLPHLEN